MSIVDIKIDSAILCQDLKVFNGIGARMEIQSHIVDEIKRIRDHQKLDITDMHIIAEVVVQLDRLSRQAIRPSDFFHITIDQTTTDLREKWKDIPLDFLMVMADNHSV